jgi:dihydrolipoamide dehydrogenase
VLAATAACPTSIGSASRRSASSATPRRARLRPHTLQAATVPIFIAGDAADDMPLLHEAADEGRIAGENAALFPK